MDTNQPETLSPGANADKPRLTEQEKKNNHIASEQKRRQAIREGFDEIAALTPGMEGQGRSEALVLQGFTAELRHQLATRWRLVSMLEANGKDAAEWRLDEETMELARGMAEEDGEAREYLLSEASRAIGCESNVSYCPDTTLLSSQNPQTLGSSTTFSRIPKPSAANTEARPPKRSQVWRAPHLASRVSSPGPASVTVSEAEGHTQRGPGDGDGDGDGLIVATRSPATLIALTPAGRALLNSAQAVLKESQTVPKECTRNDSVAIPDSDDSTGSVTEAAAAAPREGHTATAAAAVDGASSLTEAAAAPYEGYTAAAADSVPLRGGYTATAAAVDSSSTEAAAAPTYEEPGTVEVAEAPLAPNSRCVAALDYIISQQSKSAATRPPPELLILGLDALVKPPHGTPEQTQEWQWDGDLLYRREYNAVSSTAAYYAAQVQVPSYNTSFYTIMFDTDPEVSESILAGTMGGPPARSPTSQRGAKISTSITATDENAKVLLLLFRIRVVERFEDLVLWWARYMLHFKRPVQIRFVHTNARWERIIDYTTDLVPCYIDTNPLRLFTACRAAVTGRLTRTTAPIAEDWLALGMTGDEDLLVNWVKDHSSNNG